MTRTIVNFGCGACAPDGYLNVDGSPTVLLARVPLPAAVYGPRAQFVRAARAGRVKYATARRFRLADASLDGFYASHVLEHLSQMECIDLLLRVRAWLRPAGLLRIVLPDLRSLARRYLDRGADAQSFVRDTRLAIDGRRWWDVLFSHSCHRWMYDQESAARLLRSVGYGTIRNCGSGSSALEELGRLDRLTDRASESFYLEAER